MVSPYLRERWPMPPPSVRPPTPVVEMMPAGTAMPNACVAWSTSPHTQPPATSAVRAAGSTRTPFHARQIDDQAAVAAAQPWTVVSAAANRQQDAVVAGIINRGDDIGRVHAARRSSAGFLSIMRVVKFASLVVAGVASVPVFHRGHCRGMRCDLPSFFFTLPEWSPKKIDRYTLPGISVLAPGFQS